MLHTYRLKALFHQPTAINPMYRKRVQHLSKKIARKLYQKLENRIFYAIFNLTRVTNDNYGWRPGKNDAPKQ